MEVICNGHPMEYNANILFFKYYHLMDLNDKNNLYLTYI